MIKNKKFNMKGKKLLLTTAMFALVLALAGCASTSYAGPDAEVTYKEVDVTTGEHYVEEDPNLYRAGTGFKIISQGSIFPWINTIGSGCVYSGSVGNWWPKKDLYIKFDHDIVSEWCPLYELRCKNSSERLVFYVSVHPFDLTNPNADKFWRLDRIEGLISLEEAQAVVARGQAAEAEKKAAEAARVTEAQARQVQQEQIKQAEQERLANLYRQAGNNLGNLRNTSRNYGRVFGSDYLTTIFNFGDGNYIIQTQSALGLRLDPETGNYRVNGDTIIFLSSEGEYSYGTLVGTALNIDGKIYR